MKTLAQIEPRVPIGSIPFTIRAPGSYYVTTNLSGVPGGNGISIEASDVTLDLQGFVLAGTAGSTRGVNCNGNLANVVIRNGTVKGWGFGIDARSASQSRFEALRFSENSLQGLAAGSGSTVESCSAVSNQGVGIGVDQGGIVNSCFARGNFLHGIVTGAGSRVTASTAAENQAGGITVGNGCFLTQCTTQNNGTTGLAAGDDAQIVQCKSTSNGGFGIVAGTGAEVSGCVASGNFDAGIATGAGAQIAHCKANANTRGIGVQASSTIRSCTVLQSSGDGIVVTSQCTVVGNVSNDNFLARDAAGIRVAGTDNCIRENSVMANDMGLLIEAAGNLIVQNRAANNSINYRIMAPTQTMGPIVSGTLTDLANPAANFEF